MAPTPTAVESWWVLSLSLLANCNSTTAAPSPLTLSSFGLILLLSWLFLSLLFWLSPGGPAWGRHYWTAAGSRSPCGRRGNIIPGPRGLPFVGSIGLMSGLAHRRLARASSLFRAERLMAFSLGETRVVVTGHPDVAREVLSSSCFADRPVKESAYGLMFHRAIGFAPYGVYWRALRRIASNHMFSPKQIAGFAPQRAEIAAHMVAALRFRRSDHEVRLRDVLKQASLNHIMLLVFGRRYGAGIGSSGSERGSHEVRELRCLVEEGYDILGKLNWSDHLPILSSLDLQGIRSRCSHLVPRVNNFLSEIIKEHRAVEKTAAPAEDFVGVLLSLQETERLSDEDIVAILWEMVFRGTDTVAVLMEWIMARVVSHPEVQAKAQEELDRVTGRSRPVSEPDVADLVYLQALLKETIRIHPPGPLLSWSRLSTRDTVIDGRHVPAGTTAMVNMWAIARDPRLWEEPLEFRPERFLLGGNGVDISVFGSDLRLAPFGSGRRSCPGKALAWATVGFWVATLLHEYEWLPAPSDGKRRGVDLSEVLRLSCEMAVPLTVKVRPRHLHKRQT